MGLFDFFRRKKTTRPSSATPGPAQPQITKAAFARMMIDGMQLAGLEGLAYDEKEFSLSISQPPMRAFLTNAFEEYLVAPNETLKQQLIQRYLRQFRDGIPTTPESWDEVKESILPLIRSRNFLARLSLQLKLDPEKSVPWQVVGETLGLGIGHDTPASLSYVNRSNLTAWGVTYEAAMAQALENLLARSQAQMVEMQPGLYRSPWQDCYDSARLVIPEIFQGLNLKGKPVVTAPHWNLLLVAGSDDGEALTALAKITEDEMKQPRSNDTDALTLGGKGWEPFTPAVEHPAARAGLRRLRKIAYIRAYAEETAHLSKKFEKEGTDIFVSNIIALQDNATGEITTRATWGCDVLTLLPKVDRIVLGDLSLPNGKQLIGSVLWDDLASIMPELRETSLTSFPPFYQVQRWPARDQILRLPRQRN
jgi:uncharacterized protein YtpQ (UPF0354 family)